MSCRKDVSLGSIGRRRRAGVVVAFVVLDNDGAARLSHSGGTVCSIVFAVSSTTSARSGVC